ncbi:STAS domain-containing protein [Actinocatenispora rupis]|uniref:Anti-anti-sigma factor n=1 Tax=Actinocatenispora rupis TaxID=519421 RepID=A0A8J3NH30_9ACTN|nr:hypothetical protein [Actinocatenispora rupis]GID15524.1 hypothetical protein Aru02nite_64130 [Actinocatenispora rupis]
MFTRQPVAGLDVERRDWFHGTVIALVGRLSGDDAETLMAVAARPPGPHGRILLMDLSRLYLATAAGVDALVATVGALTGLGYDVRLANPQPLVRTALFLADPPSTIAVYPDLPAAYAGGEDGRIDDATQFRI